jgi:hypothetical protein
MPRKSKSTLRQYVRAILQEAPLGSYVSANRYADEQAKVRQQQVGGSKEKKSHFDLPSNESKSNNAAYDAARLVGPHMAQKLFDQMKALTPDQLQQYAGGYEERQVKRTPTAQKKIVPNARKAIATALMLGTVDSVAQALSHAVEKISSDVEHAKRSSE